MRHTHRTAFIGALLVWLAAAPALGASYAIGTSTSLAIPTAKRPPPPIAGTAYHYDRFGEAVATGDFDGDGFDDMAVGVPGEWSHRGAYVGAVNVIYGTARGLASYDNQLLTPDTLDLGSGIYGHAGDQFGKAVVAGDFDDDGFDDLAIAAPYKDRAGMTDRGMVAVVFGSAQGLGRRANVSWGRNAYAELGLALAAGDFDQNPGEDLAAGAPGNHGSRTDSGMVYVYCYLSQWRRCTYPTEILRANQPGRTMTTAVRLPGGSESGDRFGESLLATDLDGNGYDDLVIGVPGDDFSSGMVSLVYGSANGLFFNPLHHSAFDEGYPWGRERSDKFGKALAAGNFACGREAQLAIGVPGQGNAARWLSNAWGYLFPQAGAVTVIPGPHVGDPVANYDYRYSKWNPHPAAGDYWGAALAAGDFNGDGCDDLVVGAPHDDTRGFADMGSATVYLSNRRGLRYASPIHITTETLGDGPMSWLLLARSLATADFDDDGRDDLVIGVPQARTGGKRFAGSVYVVYGEEIHRGSSFPSLQSWHQNY